MTTATRWRKAAEEELAKRHEAELERTAEALAARAKAEEERKTKEAAEQKRRDAVTTEMRAAVKALLDSDARLDGLASELVAELATNAQQMDALKSHAQSLGIDDLNRIGSRLAQDPEVTLWRWLAGRLYPALSRPLSRVDTSLRHHDTNMAALHDWIVSELEGRHGLKLK
jgi:hypothetical protein